MASASNSTGGGEIVHISLGTSANFITSHLLNLQGLAATTYSSASRQRNDDDDDADNNNCNSSLCDPSVTHSITRSSDSHCDSYMYVPRALIVDGRDSFGTPWGRSLSAANQQQQRFFNASSFQTQQSFRTSCAATSATADITTWGGTVSLLDPSKVAVAAAAAAAAVCVDDGDDTVMEQHDSRLSLTNRRQQLLHAPAAADASFTIGKEKNPLNKFHEAASLVGLSPQHSRFLVPASCASKAAMHPCSSYNANSNDDDDDEDENEDEDYYYHLDRERSKQLQLDKIQHQNQMKLKEWNECMESSWDEAYYGIDSTSGGGGGGGGVTKYIANDNPAPSSSTYDDIQNNANEKKATLPLPLEVHWHDYWMPPRPRPMDYQVPLPFSDSSPLLSPPPLWSTSYHRGYAPLSSDSTSNGGGNDNNGFLSNSWREHVLSDKLRRILEASDIVRGFNIFIDGGIGIPIPHEGSASSKNNIIQGGGGFHAGLATSLLEELSEECRSAGRWAVMVDPFSSYQSVSSTMRDDESNANLSFDHRTYQFRQCLNAGLALHGLTTNADAFLPVSLCDAYHALRIHNGTAPAPSTYEHQDARILSNRVLFEGSAAIALALETSTLFYRLRRDQDTNARAFGGGRRGAGGECAATRRSRIGIQSGYYQGYGGGCGCSNRYEDDDNEPYATSPSLTYREFLSCLRPSSDRRRSILELDVLLRPITYPSLSSSAGNVLAPTVLASLTSSGLLANNDEAGQLQRRVMRGTSLELMVLEQRGQRYRSLRARSSTAMPPRPGEWLEDISTKTSEGGGLLSSLSGNNTSSFGKRSDHRHFALSSSLRPADSDLHSFSSQKNNSIPAGACVISSFLRSMMESMGSTTYRPEISSGLVVNHSAVDLTEVGSYWRTIFSDQRSPIGRDGGESSQRSSRECAMLTPILSVLGNSTRSYPRMKSVSMGMIDALHSRQNRGHLSRDVMSGIIPEKDDCEEALEYCRELADVYEPPNGSGLLSDFENDSLNAYFDEGDDN